MYIVNRVDSYSGVVLERNLEEFDNYEDAQQYAEECNDSYSEGADVLDSMGRNYNSPEGSHFEVEEV